MARIGSRGTHRLYFSDHTMDFNTQYLLGYASAGGAAVGEVLHALSTIRSGKRATWVRSFSALADRVEAMAHDLARRGHRVSAREAFLRATTYHRAVTFGLAEDDPRLKERIEHLERCFDEAARRLEWPCAPVRIPWRGTSLPGRLVRPADDEVARPTLITIGGGELYNEELYFWTGEAAVRRGWNALLVDLPGQGRTFLDGLTFEGESEQAFGAVMDFVVAQRGVDPARVAALGVSLGGYLVLRAASCERRLAAIALSTPMPAPFDWLARGSPIELSGLSRRQVEALFTVIGWLNPEMAFAFHKWFHRLGVTNISEALDLLRRWTVDLRAVQCPVLCLLGAGEAKTLELQTERAVQGLGERATFRLATVEEGADGHCQSNNFPMLQSLVFDWLDARLGHLPAS